MLAMNGALYLNGRCSQILEIGAERITTAVLSCSCCFNIVTMTTMATLRLDEW